MFVTIHSKSDREFIKIYSEALKRTLQIEGGYSNDPRDPGGETIFGISRVHHPNLLIFKDIDNLKLKGIKINSVIEDLRVKFERDISKVYANYADFIDLSNPVTIDDRAFYGLFAFSVNRGLSRAKEIAKKQIEQFGRIQFGDSFFLVVDSYRKLLNDKPNLHVYKNGWVNRILLTFK